MKINVPKEENNVVNGDGDQWKNESNARKMRQKMERNKEDKNSTRYLESCAENEKNTVVEERERERT